MTDLVETNIVTSCERPTIKYRSSKCTTPQEIADRKAYFRNYQRQKKAKALENNELPRKEIHLLYKKTDTEEILLEKIEFLVKRYLALKDDE